MPLAEAVKYQILVMFLLKNGTPQVLSAQHWNSVVELPARLRLSNAMLGCGPQRQKINPE